MKKYLLKYIAIAFFIIVVAMCFETMILRKVDKTNAFRLSNILINQVIDNIKTNQRDNNELYSSVKDGYMVCAQSVAYILDSKPSVEFNVDELKKIAGLLSIDEINLFDKTGKIYSGTVPQYYNLSFDSGEQMEFFKPMLSDKSLTMCQDVTPNTSEGKYMMYAIAWNSTGDKMIQVGIEPARLLSVMNRSELDKLILEIPVYNGVEIYIADADSGKIIARNPITTNATCLEDFGIEKREELLNQNIDEQIFRKIGFKNYFSFSKINNLIVCVSYSVNANLNTFIVTMYLFFIYLSVASFFIILIYIGKMKDNKEKLNQFGILSNMSKIYHSMYLVDFTNNTATEYTASKSGKKLGAKYENASETIATFITENVSPIFIQTMNSFVDGKTIADRLEGKKIITEDFISNDHLWFRASFVSVQTDKTGKPEKAIFTIRNVDDEKTREAFLIHKSTTDELTGTFNRHAYEENLKKINLDDNFEYFEFDINELKNANDTIGHEAGDEMIRTAARFMNECFGSFGRIYRTGGDEFVGIFTDVHKNLMDAAKNDFDEKTAAWKGKFVDKLSVSYGWVSSKEKKWESILEITKEADQRMYKSKAAYYQKSGIDRRANQKAYFAASSLYTKILKVNLTTDTFKVINMDKEEQTAEMGYSESFSKWNYQIAERGLINEFDKDYYLMKFDVEYLRKYFKSGRKLLAISYKRKINKAFKQVICEIIPADDYDHENQNCYLYVKNIEV